MKKIKELGFTTIGLDEFARIHAEMSNCVRHNLDSEVFYIGDHAEFGRITLYQPGPDNRAMMLQHGSVSLEKTGSY